MADTVEGSGEGSGEGWAAAPGEALTTIPIKAKRGKLIVKSELAKKISKKFLQKVVFKCE